jgi:competence protein ComGC
MTTHSQMKKTYRVRLNRARGATVVEYLIGLIAIVSVLLIPVPGKNKSVVVLLEEAIKKEHSAYIYAQSLPSPKK